MGATDLKSDIASNAQGPQSASGDGISVRSHSIRDQIAADRYLAAKDAVHNSTNPIAGLRMVRLVPPAAV